MLEFLLRGVFSCWRTSFVMYFKYRNQTQNRANHSEFINIDLLDIS